MDNIFEVYSALQDAFIPLLALVFGLIEFLKDQLSIEGKMVTFMSFLVGVILASVIAAVKLFPGWGAYVGAVIFILSSGLVASGFYKFTAK